MQIIKKNISDLIPADYNPRKDLKPSDYEYQKIKNSLQEFGYVDPIVWNKRSGCVVGGHQRLKVLLELGWTECHVSIVDLDPVREKALNVALNKISGEWDEEKLNEILMELDIANFDLSMTGFDMPELTEFDLGGNISQIEEKELKPYKKNHVLISFPPDEWPQIRKYIKELSRVQGIEIEESAN